MSVLENASMICGHLVKIKLGREVKDEAYEVNDNERVFPCTCGSEKGVYAEQKYAYNLN